MAAEQAPGAAVDDSKRVRLFRIDVHTHIIPEHMPDWSAKFGYGDFVKLKTSGLCSVRHACAHRPNERREALPTAPARACSPARGVFACFATALAPPQAHMYKGDKFFREIQDNCFRAEPRLKQCDSHGVVVQVLSTVCCTRACFLWTRRGLTRRAQVPVMFSYHARPKDTLEMARFLNDHIAAVVKKHPKRFIGLGTVPMQDPELAVKELRRCVQELGFAGIQIGTRVNEWRLSEPALFPVFAEGTCSSVGASWRSRAAHGRSNRPQPKSSARASLFILGICQALTRTSTGSPGSWACRWRHAMRFARSSLVVCLSGSPR
jgi:aminocarboxymuconate-semialdehyde decarboxylase